MSHKGGEPLCLGAGVAVIDGDIVSWFAILSSRANQREEPFLYRSRESFLNGDIVSWFAICASGTALSEDAGVVPIDEPVAIVADSDGRRMAIIACEFNDLIVLRIEKEIGFRFIRIGYFIDIGVSNRILLRDRNNGLSRRSVS